MNSLDRIKEIFTLELEKRGLRKTTERFTILETIYSRDDHFDVDNLYVSLQEQNFHVSRATVYNTLDVLVDSGLVKKHRFVGDGAVYERALGYRQHGHLICMECNDIQEFCDPRLQNIQDNVSGVLGFEISDHTLVFYGHCNKPECQQKAEQLKAS